MGPVASLGFRALWADKELLVLECPAIPGHANSCPMKQDSIPIGQPTLENRAAPSSGNRAQNRDKKNGNIFNDFFKSSIKMGRE